MSNAAQRYAFVLEPVDCCNCGIVFAVPGDWHRQKKKKHESFYCPNGHSNYYPGQTDAEKLQRRLDMEKNRREAAERRSEALERSRAATKGHLTRTRKRIANGVCPCCNRTFKDLHRHMKTKHPDYGVAKDE